MTFNAQVTQAEFRQEDRHEPNGLYLTLLIAVHNDTDNAVTVRPTDPALVHVARWRRTKIIPVTVGPRMAIDPMGRVADYLHFPEGQYTIPARSEQRCYFFFVAVTADNKPILNRPGLKLRLTVRLPSPHQKLIGLPSISYR